MNNVLQVRIESWDLVACHALNNEKVAPVIVKFLYHQHRDLVWRRKSFLRNIKNSKDMPIFVEECLAPLDRKLKVGASRMNLSTFLRKQEIYVFNKNSIISGAVKVKDVADLVAFKKTYVPKITHEPPSYPPAIPAARLNHQMVSDEYNFSKEPESFVVNGTPCYQHC